MFVRACLCVRTRTILPIRHFSLSISRASGHNKVSECVPLFTNRLLTQSTVEQNQDGRVFLTCISRLCEVLTAQLQAREFLTKPVVWHTASTLECAALFKVAHHSAELLCRKSSLPFAVSEVTILARCASLRLVFRSGWRKSQRRHQHPACECS